MNSISVKQFNRAVNIDRRASDLPNAIADCVERAVESRIFPEGSFLPSAADIANQLNVSAATVRNGFANLVARGVLESKRGPGGGYWVARKEAVLLKITDEFIARAKAVGSNEEAIAATLAARFPNHLKFSEGRADRRDAHRYFGSIHSRRTDIAENHDLYFDTDDVEG